MFWEGGGANLLYIYIYILGMLEIKTPSLPQDEIGDPT